MSIYAELQRRVGEEVRITLRSGAKLSGKLERAEDQIAYLESGEAITAGEVASVGPAEDGAEEGPDNAVGAAPEEPEADDGAHTHEPVPA